jgi:hypothetical protein
MAELVRSFPDKPLQAKEFGPEALRLYLDVQASLARLGTGAVSVQVDDADVIVFLNEQYAATPHRIDDLVPGDYRVLIRKGRTVGRMYITRVQSGKTASVEVGWTFDQAVHTSPDWTGFEFPDEASRNRLLARYATEFARAMHARTVVTVGIGQVASRRSIIGKAFNVDSAGPGRTASVVIEPVEPSESHLRALGAYLAGATDHAPPREPQPEETEDDDEPVVQVGSQRKTVSRAGRRILLWSALPMGAAAIAGGAYLIWLDGRGTCDRDLGKTCADLFDTGTQGIIAIGVGTALMAGSAYLLWRDHRRSTEEVAASGLSFTVGSVNGIAWGGEF